MHGEEHQQPQQIAFLALHERKKRQSTTFCYRNGSFPGMGKHLFDQAALTLLWKQKKQNLFPHMHHPRKLSSANNQHDIRYSTVTSPICPLDWNFNFIKTFCRKLYKGTRSIRSNRHFSLLGIPQHEKNYFIITKLITPFCFFFPFWTTKSLKDLALFFFTGGGTKHDWHEEQFVHWKLR